MYFEVHVFLWVTNNIKADYILHIVLFINFHNYGMYK